MDKTEVLRILTGLDDTGAIAEVHFDMSELGERAEVIVQAAEEDRIGAVNSELDSFIERIAEIEYGHVATIMDLRAQVAVMAGMVRQTEFAATGGIGEACCPWCGISRDYFEEDGGHTEDCQWFKALSAAPKVVARLKMCLCREPMGDRYLETTSQDSHLAMGTLRYGETYDVLVMMAEQAQESEQDDDILAEALGAPTWRE